MSDSEPDSKADTSALDAVLVDEPRAEDRAVNERSWAELQSDSESPSDRNVVPADVILASWLPLPPARSLPVRIWRGLCTSLEFLFGIGSLLGILAVLSTIPLLQFLSLGYLLEASGRIARTGKFREGFIGIRTMARVGSIIAGTWLMLLLPRFVSGLANDAELADPGSPAAAAWRIGVLLFTVVILTHIAMCWFAGGKLRHFFWPIVAVWRTGLWLTFGLFGRLCRPLVERYYPSLAEDLYQPLALASWFPPAAVWQGIRQGGWYVDARDGVWHFLVSLRLRYYFWMGVRGFAGAFLWLLVPSLLLLVGARAQVGFLQFVGALSLMIVSLYLPFLQARFAAENRFRAMFEVRAIRQVFSRAPLGFWFALLVTLAFAIPLYLFNVENVIRPLAWAPSLVFVTFIYPARLLTGWVVGLGMHRPAPRHWIFRWSARLGALPLVAIYVLFVWLSQYTRWYGEITFFEQHAFLLPVPFLGL